MTRKLHFRKDDRTMRPMYASAARDIFLSHRVGLESSSTGFLV